MSIVRAPFGVMPSGEAVDQYTLQNAGGSSVSIITYGGTLTAIRVPDRAGKLSDVCLGFDTLEKYLNVPGYMGALIGRYANRIGGARFTLNGKTYSLYPNEGENTLHGGKVGFNRKVWAAQTVSEPGVERLVLTCRSEDGEEGYPGALDVRVTYSFDDEDELTIHYEAVCDQDTVVNLTNHCYFNLAGHNSGTVEDHVIQINADRFTVVRPDSIPTGELRPVDGTPFDLRAGLRIGDGLARIGEDEQMRFGKGYDHNFAISCEGEGVVKAVELYDPASGRVMETFTDMPGVQFYSANMLESDFAGKDGVMYGHHAGLCLETQFFPDSPNRPEVPSCTLRAGQKYDYTTVYKFSVRENA